MCAKLKHFPEHDLEVGVFSGAVSADDMLRVFSERDSNANWLGIYCHDADMSGIDIARLPALKRAVTAVEGKPGESKSRDGEPRRSALVNLSKPSELFVRFWVHYASDGACTRSRELFCSIEAACQWLGLPAAVSTALAATAAGLPGGEADTAEAVETRRRILRAASRLFRQRGFEAITLADIMEAAGFAYSGVDGFVKDDLIVHALLEAMGEAQPVEGSLGDIAADYLSPAHKLDVAGGCAMAALASETIRQSPEARAAMTAGLDWQIERLSRHAPGADAAAQRRAAIRAWSAMVGALILARVSDDESLSQEVLDETQAWITNPAVAAARAAGQASPEARPH